MEALHVLIRDNLYIISACLAIFFVKTRVLDGYLGPISETSLLYRTRLRSKLYLH